MYLARIKVQGFRSLRDFACTFSPGLNVVLGENNVGKTNLLDAIRLPLSGGTGPRDIWPKVSDISHDIKGRLESDRFQIDLTFEALTQEEQWVFLECLAPSLGQGVAQIHYRFQYAISASGQEVKKVKVWGGEVEKGSLGVDILDNLRLVFLPALRDAEADLRPGRSTRLARLLTEVSSSEAERVGLETLLQDANAKIRQDQLVKRAVEVINENLQGITGPILSQVADIGLTDPSFQRIAGSMRALIGDGMPGEVEENGLGYNNLLYIAAVVGELRRAKERENPSVDLPLLLVEEPEAHLHPQLQLLLSDYLCSEAKGSVQVILTSHSPSLSARVPGESVLVMHRGRTGSAKGNPVVKPLKDCGLDVSELGDIRRYLDATKSTLFFARGVILVEGIAEALLIPKLAKQIGVNLDQLGVSVINLNGLTFGTFAKLFYDGNLQIPCAVVTDADPGLTEKERELLKVGKLSQVDADAICYPVKLGRTSATADSLRKAATGFASVFLSAKTLEWDLAIEDNTLAMAEVYQEMRPVVGAKLNKALASTNDPRERARMFWDAFDEKDKGRFAQRLAARMEEGMKLNIPGYIRDAVKKVTADVQS